jgi:mannan endo-1,4-beta-mannosidase
MQRTLTFLAAALAISCAADTRETPPPESTPSTPTTPTAPSTPTTPETPPPGTVDIVVRADSGRTPISPYIYGTNQDAGMSGWLLRRWGGNRMTGYNWETNASNAGVDYINNSDLFLIADRGLSDGDARTPARAATAFHDQSLAMGAQTIVTLPMAGFAAADVNGPVSESQTAPSSRWVRVEPKKPTAFSDSPDLRDGVVYSDEFVNFLVKKYGPASSARGVKFYSLDNEPALWPYTHPRLHPQKTGAVELADKSIALAAAVKAVDPSAQVLGPAAYGMAEFLAMQDAPDWKAISGGYDWYIDYYLTRMKAAEATAGHRLLDVLDIHWYPEAKGDHRISEGGSTTLKDIAARLQAPRTLWDSTYKEDSWIAQSWSGFLPLLRKLKQSIDTRYPGTKLAITEYDYGSGFMIDGGISQADLLGIFGREGVYIASRWAIQPNDVYTAAAFNLFRNFDGKGGTFGNTGVLVRANDPARLSIYASIDGADASKLHLIMLNRDLRDTVTARVRLGGGTWTGGEAWGFDRNSAKLTAQPAPTVTDGVLSYQLLPLTATHVVLR